MYVFYLRSRGLRANPIYFFEPDPALYSRLQTNISINRLEYVHGFNAAVGDKPGKAVFFRNKTDDSSGTLVPEAWSKHELQPIEVDQTSFAHFVTEHRLSNICAKVDVEGAEEAFFAGAQTCLDRLDSLVMEVLGPASVRGLPGRMINEGKLNGYYINDYYLHYSKSGEFRYVPPFCNWLFCKDDPEKLRSRLTGTKFQVGISNNTRSFRRFLA
jgi:FkbM family methyltransferase